MTRNTLRRAAAAAVAATAVAALSLTAVSAANAAPSASSADVIDAPAPTITGTIAVAPIGDTEDTDAYAARLAAAARITAADADRAAVAAIGGAAQDGTIVVESNGWAVYSVLVTTADGHDHLALVDAGNAKVLEDLDLGNAVTAGDEAAVIDSHENMADDAELSFDDGHAGMSNDRAFTVTGTITVDPIDDTEDYAA